MYSADPYRTIYVLDFNDKIWLIHFFQLVLFWAVISLISLSLTSHRLRTYLSEYVRTHALTHVCRVLAYSYPYVRVLAYAYVRTYVRMHSCTLYCSLTHIFKHTLSFLRIHIHPDLCSLICQYSLVMRRLFPRESFLRTCSCENSVSETK